MRKPARKPPTARPDPNILNVWIEPLNFRIELVEQQRTINVPNHLTKHELVCFLGAEIEAAWRDGAAYALEISRQEAEQRYQELKMSFKIQ